MKIKKKCVRDIKDLLVRGPTCITADQTVSNLFFAEFSTKKITAVMRKDFLYLKEDTPLTEVVSLMLENRVNELPVVAEGGRVVGEANVLELIKSLSDHEHLALAHKKAKEDNRD